LNIVTLSASMFSLMTVSRSPRSIFTPKLSQHKLAELMNTLTRCLLVMILIPTHCSSSSRYVRLLNDNFIERDDYEIVSKSDSRIGDHMVAGNNALIVSPFAFKESMMMLQTEKSKLIRRYYSLLERILKDYMKYTQFIERHNMQLEHMKLIEENDKYKKQALPIFDIDPSSMEYTEYVYVLTSPRYYRQHMFKIGKSIHPKNRLVSHNTTAATEDDAMFYTDMIPTFDCGGLEKLLHRALSRYHTTKEWFKVPHSHLRSIIDLVSSQQTALLEEINNNLNKNLDHVENIAIEDFSQQRIMIDEQPSDDQVSIVEPIVENTKKSILTCNKCNRMYTSNGPYQKHIQQCINIVENDDCMYTCALCNTSFTTKRRYDNHVDGGCPYHNVCETCNHVFISAISLANHVKICKDIAIETLSPICDMNPTKPVKLVERVGFDYRCIHCKKKFRSRTTAIRHAKLCMKEYNE